MSLFDRLALDEPTSETDPFGGTTEGWSEVFQARATIIYQRGGESVEAARLTGRPIYKVQIRQSADARRVTTDWRTRDVRRGTEYNITEVDAITDRKWAWLVIGGYQS